MIKLIATDLDGTLLNDKKQLTQTNLQALHYAHEKGIKIVVCTGRPYLATHFLIDEIGLKSEEDYLIVFNGAQVRRSIDGHIVVENSLTHEDMLIWYQETRRLDLPINVIDSEWVYEPLSYPNGYESFYASKLTAAPSMVKDYASFSEEHQFLKFVITVDEEHLANQIPKINPELKSRYSISRSHPFQLEIMKQDVDKGRALKQLGDHLEIRMEEMMTIGDQMNDESMIKMAGTGVAMGNAVPAIKEMAQFVTKSHVEDGVAHAIYNYIK